MWGYIEGKLLHIDKKKLGKAFHGYDFQRVKTLLDKDQLIHKTKPNTRYSVRAVDGYPGCTIANGARVKKQFLVIKLGGE